MIVIQRARRVDLGAIVAILAADTAFGHADCTDPAEGAAYARAFAAIAGSPTSDLFVAWSKGRVVGTFQLDLIVTLLDHGATRAVLEAVHVAPDQRGRGVGAAMVAFAVEHARRRGAASLSLGSNKQRVDAHRFYERLGFARSHEGFKMKLR